jgi:hypothetical protein
MFVCARSSSLGRSASQTTPWPPFTLFTQDNRFGFTLWIGDVPSSTSQRTRRSHGCIRVGRRHSLGCSTLLSLSIRDPANADGFSGVCPYVRNVASASLPCGLLGIGRSCSVLGCFPLPVILPQLAKKSRMACESVLMSGLGIDRFSGARAAPRADSLKRRLERPI